MGKFFPGESISKIHGKPRVVGGVTVFPMFHPAAALRDGRLRPVLAADFASLAIYLATAPVAGPEPASPADQMTLFGTVKHG
jgi:DNA polymerase